MVANNGSAGPSTTGSVLNRSIEVLTHGAVCRQTSRLTQTSLCFHQMSTSYPSKPALNLLPQDDNWRRLHRFRLVLRPMLLTLPFNRDERLLMLWFMTEANPAKQSMLSKDHTRSDLALNPTNPGQRLIETYDGKEETQVSP